MQHFKAFWIFHQYNNNPLKFTESIKKSFLKMILVCVLWLVDKWKKDCFIKIKRNNYFMDQDVLWDWLI